MPEGVKTGYLAKKCNARAKTSQRQQRCHPLEPVLEHSVACLDEAPRSKHPEQQYEWGTKRCRRKGNILVRLRDWYVRLMNDMASSADLTGVSAMYGCSSGQADYLGTTAVAFARRAQEEEEEMAAVQISQPSPCHKMT